MAANATHVTSEETFTLIAQNKDNPNFKVVDVRSGMQRCMGHIPGSLHVPVGDIEGRLGEFDKDTRYVMVCRSGARKIPPGLKKPSKK